MNGNSGAWNSQVPGAELFDAVERNDLVAVKEMLAREADVNSLDPRYPPLYTAPPLVCAAAAGYSEMVRLLLANGANVNGRDSRGGTALIWACNGGYIDCASLLLAAGADPSLRNDSGYTAHGRIMKRNEELLSLLEEHGGSL